jgi:DNA-binding NtrC family response regulator
MSGRHAAAAEAVLVVDDEPQIRRALRTSLEAHGFRVATSSRISRSTSRWRSPSARRCSARSTAWSSTESSTGFVR